MYTIYLVMGKQQRISKSYEKLEDAVLVAEKTFTANSFLDLVGIVEVGTSNTIRYWQRGSVMGFKHTFKNYMKSHSGVTGSSSSGVVRDGHSYWKVHV